MSDKIPFKIKTYINLYALLHKKEFSYPLVVEDNLPYSTQKELIFFGYKALGHRMERAEKGKHIEEYFEKQSLDFTPPSGFTADSSVIMTSAGDLLSSRWATVASTEKLWDEAEDFLFDADFRCANLESPIMPSSPATYVPYNFMESIALNNSPEMFEQFYCGGKGFNVFSTANNHSLDMGPEGVLTTLDILNQHGCAHAGTASSEEERDNFPILEKNGVKIAYLSYTYALNRGVLPKGQEYLTNYIRLNNPETDISAIERHVRMAKLERGADIVVCSLHWSTENESYPLQNVIDMGHRIMSLGVDYIVGNHSHTTQPMEKYTYIDPFTKRPKDGLIVYAHGDTVGFIESIPGGWHGPNVPCSYIVRVAFSKGKLNGEPATLISDVKIRPMYAYTKVENGVCTAYRLLNFKKLLNELDTGTNRFSMSRAEIAEVRRLGMLSQKIIKWEISA